MILNNIYISHKLNCFNILEWFLSFMNELKNLNLLLYRKLMQWCFVSKLKCMIWNLFLIIYIKIFWIAPSKLEQMTNSIECEMFTFQVGYIPVWRIQNVLMRIRIPLFKLMRIRTRIQILFVVWTNFFFKPSIIVFKVSQNLSL